MDRPPPLLGLLQEGLLDGAGLTVLASDDVIDPCLPSWCIQPGSLQGSVSRWMVSKRRNLQSIHFQRPDAEIDTQIEAKITEPVRSCAKTVHHRVSSFPCRDHEEFFCSSLLYQIQSISWNAK